MLRRAGPGDVPAITRLYLELSAESFYGRLNTGPPAPTRVAQLASLGNGAACLVASPPANPGHLVAEARYVPIAPGTAELALTVHDGYQSAGMGYLLLDALMGRAREDGLARLRAVVLLGNTPMLRLLQHYGWALAAPTEGFSVAFLEISAVGGMPGWPAGPTAQRYWRPTGGAGRTGLPGDCVCPVALLAAFFGPATWATMLVTRHAPDAGIYLAHFRPIAWRARGTQN